MRTYFQAYIVVLHKVFPRDGCMQAHKTVQGKIVEKKIVCRTDEQIKLVQKLVKENCSSVRGLSNLTRNTELKEIKLIMVDEKKLVFISRRQAVVLGVTT